MLDWCGIDHKLTYQKRPLEKKKIRFSLALASVTTLDSKERKQTNELMTYLQCMSPMSLKLSLAYQ